MPVGNVCSTIGSREATTGLPIAAYSKTFVERLTSVKGSRRVGAMPMSARATAAGTSSIGIRPWNVTLGDASPSDRARSMSGLGIAAAVDVERDAQLRPRCARSGDGVDGDVDLVGRRQGAGIDEADRPVLGEGAAG